MSSTAVQKVVATLLSLLQRPEWEARHGGLLGLKYLVAVRGYKDPSLLPMSLPHMLKGLDDPVEDVGAVAAASLIPAASELATRFPDHLGPTVERLWNLLGEQDELAAASNSYMGLLAALLSQDAAKCLHETDVLAQRLPQLWPFLSHTSSAVRKSTLQTLSTLADSIVSLGVPVEVGAPSLLQNALRHIFQRALLETSPEIQALTEEVLENFLIVMDLSFVIVSLAGLEEIIGKLSFR
jgi:TATA-binding protein-associated factor